ncbi:hypothetical protein R3P38DRAFT_3548305 [Favolaschia claudopus]|uniref:Transposase n=1 Tax=Favolaschia claudopus TaxID=2862362 RepID=A0AAW0B5Q5_9AGAR
MIRRGNRRHIPKEQKQLITTMSAHMSVPDIAAATDISERTIYRIIRTWRTTGDHVRIPLQLGRPRILTSFDVAYLEGLVARTPDIYLFELQECLYEATGLDVAKTTIRDALLRMGYVRPNGLGFNVKLDNTHLEDWFSWTKQLAIDIQRGGRWHGPPLECERGGMIFLSEASVILFFRQFASMAYFTSMC